MTNKVQKVREKVEKLKSNLMYGACSSQVAMETRCKEEAYNEVLAILDSMQEEPKECMYSKDNYTDEDRKVLCDSCEEKCELNKKEEPVNNGLDLGCGVIWKDEEPLSDDLEEASRNYGDELDNVLTVIGDDDDNSIGEYATQAFEAGAQWQKEQMMKGAVKGGCFSYRNGYKHISCDIDEKLTDIKLGDKVKLFIIKED